MGCSRKVEGLYFLLVVVSTRTTHFIVRNFNQKIGVLKLKIRNQWTIPVDNPMNFTRIIGP
jgi:hypothetical protein